MNAAKDDARVQRAPHSSGCSCGVLLAAVQGVEGVEGLQGFKGLKAAGAEEVEGLQGGCSVRLTLQQAVAAQLRGQTRPHSQGP